MSDLFLDLQDKDRILNFIAEYSDFLNEKEKTGILPEKMEALAKRGRKIAISVWPARYALRAFFVLQGVVLEWQRLLGATRMGTSHILYGLHMQDKKKNVDEIVESDDAREILTDDMRMEISAIRHELRIDFWKEKNKDIAGFVKEGEKKMRLIAERLATLREIAVVSPAFLQDEIFSKLSHFEDRIFYNGEDMSLEILDAEIVYYREQKELSPIE